MLPTRYPAPPARGCSALPYALSCTAHERLPYALPATRTRASRALPYAPPASACPANCQRPALALAHPYPASRALPCPAARATPCPAARTLPCPCTPCQLPASYCAHALLAQPVRCPHTVCTTCARLACAAAAAKLPLPLASSVPCPAVGCVLAFDTVGQPLVFDSWLEGLHLYLHSVTRNVVSLFEHTSGSLQAPKAPAEPAADAGEEVRTQFRTVHIAYKRCRPPMLCIPLWLGATPPPPPPAVLGCLALPLTFPALSDLITVANEGGRSGVGGSGRGRHQELEPSCVTACAPTSTVYAHPSTILSCIVVPFASSGPTEGGDPTAADTATSRRSPRLETPPGFPSRTSLPHLQPDAADFGGPGVVGGGDAGGAASGGARSPLVGGVGGTGVGGAGAGGAGSGGVLQSLPRWPIFLEQPSSSLPEPTPTCITPPLLFPPPDSPLPTHAQYVPLSVSLTGRREPVSCAASPAPSRVTREPVVLPLPPPSSLPAVPDLVSDLARATRPTIPCFLAALVTAPASSHAAACALVAELAAFATTCRRAYLAGLVSASSCPPSVGGELACSWM
ncbi:unnamed protein product [Closterium sp. NIES-53]